MSISLIMCSWNRPWYLEPMLQSIQQQTMQPDEVIIWNNNKNLVEKVNKIVGNKAIIYHNDKNIGGFGRFYAARDIAKSDYVIFIDDDWKLKPNQCQMQKEVLKQ